MVPFLIAILSVTTGLIGVLLGHFLSERRSRKDELVRMRLDAYRDFIQATSNLVAGRRAGHTKDDIKDLGALNDAKVRICIFSDAPVVESLEDFWLQGGTLEKEHEILAFTRLCRAMRAGLGSERLNVDIRLSDILFRLEPSTYSYRTKKEQEEKSA